MPKLALLRLNRWCRRQSPRSQLLVRVYPLVPQDLPLWVLAKPVVAVRARRGSLKLRLSRRFVLTREPLVPTLLLALSALRLRPPCSRTLCAEASVASAMVPSASAAAAAITPLGFINILLLWDGHGGSNRDPTPRLFRNRCRWRRFIRRPVNSALR